MPHTPQRHASITQHAHAALNMECCTHVDAQAAHTMHETEANRAKQALEEREHHLARPEPDRIACGVAHASAEKTQNVTEAIEP